MPAYNCKPDALRIPGGEMQNKKGLRHTPRALCRHIASLNRFWSVLKLLAE